MKYKMWIISVLSVSIFIIGGCSASDSSSDKNPSMDHSNMTEEEMSNMEGMDQPNKSGEEMVSIENGHDSHTNPLVLNDSTGENELSLPPLIESKDGVIDITAQQGTTEFYEGVQTETYGYNGSFLGPIIQVIKDETVTFRTNNELSEPTTFHWHGVDIPGEGDGGPHQILQPGESEDVKFTVNQEFHSMVPSTS